ncbi:translocation/assembly module TamB domain-containing protein [Tepidimonas charontis]|uniref:Translocation and assembly module TamB n=1 Tax=Tepidimonas charontis TaxID=2267262 RepID=A0A554XFV2_9BURK|nr:translocation/assembly module TamB domain-containing protein [Tepidimonas charontis]TSE34710.1 Translocation and assembly module TamB [Tepidimonas charontis]
MMHITGSTPSDAAEPIPARNVDLGNARGHFWMRGRLRRLAVGILAAAGALAGLLLALLIAALTWLRQDTSLPQALTWGQRWLGPEWQLTWSGARGPLAVGGEIDTLRLDGPSFSLHVEGLHWRWAADFWPRLWRERRVALQTLGARIVTLRRERVHPDTTGLPPPPEARALRLPWLAALQVPIHLTRLDSDGVTVEQLQAEYRYVGSNGAAADPTPPASAHADASSLAPTAQNHSAVRAANDATTVSHTLVIETATVRLTHPSGQLRWRGHATLALQAGSQVTVAFDAKGQWSGQRIGWPAQAGPMQLRLDGPLRTDAALRAALTWHAERSGNAPAMTLSADLTVAPWAAWPVRALTLDTQALDLALLWPGAPHTHLSGTARWQPDADAADGTSGRLRASLRNARSAPWNRGGLPLDSADLILRHDGSTLIIEALQARLAQGQLTARANAVPPAEGRLTVDAVHTLSLTLHDLDPARVWAGLDATPLQAVLQWQRGNTARHSAAVPATFDASLRWGATLHAHARGRWYPGQQVTGTLAATVPGARLEAEGALPLGQRLLALPHGGQLALRGDDLSHLRRWLQDGAARASAIAPELAQRIARAADAVPDGDVMVQAHWGSRLPLRDARGADPWRLMLSSHRLQWPPMGDTRDRPLRVQTMRFEATGEGHRAHLRASATLPRTPRTLRLALPDATVAWSGENPHTARVWANDVPLLVHAGDASAQLRLQHLVWEAGVVQLAGQTGSLPLTPWLAALGFEPPADAALQPDASFALGAQWDVTLPLTAEAARRTRPHLAVTLQRNHGDVWLRALTEVEPAPAAGLREAFAHLRWDGATAQARLRWDSRLGGDADIQLTLNWPASHQATMATLPWLPPPDAAVRGTARLRTPPLAVLTPWLPPGWRIDGQLQANVAISGSWSEPDWSGALTGDDIRLTQRADGIDWRVSPLRATVADHRLTLQALTLRTAANDPADDIGGTLQLSGWAQWDAETRTPRVALTARADRWRPLARVDRRVVLSGMLDMRAQQRHLDLGGQLRLDTLRWLLPSEDTPTLSADVVVRGRTPSAMPSLWPAGWTGSVDLGIDLGADARISGRGLDTGLRGTLHWRQRDDLAPQLVGEVRTVDGHYRIYGQRLTLTHGVLRFNGAIDNPALDLLATRTASQQTVGVAVTGTAQVPRVRLYADPALPETDILAWLILGRPLSGAGVEAALVQRAALALLSARQGGSPSLPARLGLDELSVDTGGPQGDGSVRAASVSLGKRLSDRLYLGYQRSVFGLVGTVSVLYDLSRHLTLRARAGDEQGVELLYQRRYD